MLIRRAEEASYAGVTPHQFRHTFSDAWLKSGGWKATWGVPPVELDGVQFQ
jgi:integrase